MFVEQSQVKLFGQDGAQREGEGGRESVYIFAGLRITVLKIE